jgi:hypothetical protein
MNAKLENEEAAEPIDRITRDLSPTDKLQFAKWVLKGFFTFFVVSIGVWLLQESCGDILIEICKTGLLPIATFVIGDYFGSKG